MSLKTCVKVLSIQSHVVSGYVGNKSATFPLQLLGFDVDAINSVQFSNHTGYSTILGQVLDSKDLLQLYEGLAANNLDDYSYLLTGYIGSKSFLLAVSEVYKKLKKRNSNLKYVCDPVLGDEGTLYVPEDLVPIYKDEIIPLADIITPNQFEAETLTDVKIINYETAKEAMMKLHSMGPKLVVISSLDLEMSKGVLVLLASTMKDGSFECLKIEMPHLEAHYTGSGDLFAALLLAWCHKQKFNLKGTLDVVASTMYKVLKNTLDYYLCHTKDSSSRAPLPAEIELKLVQSKTDIENPIILFNAGHI